VQPFAADLSGTPPIESPAFWKRPVRLPASADPDTATAQTIAAMCQQIRDSARDAGRYTFPDGAARVSEVAHGAVQGFGGLGRVYGGIDQPLAGDTQDPVAVACGAFWWCKVFVRFVHHEFIIRQRLGETGHLQGLISPEVLVRMDKPEGDCAIFSECVAAFLTVFGIPWELVTVAVNPSEPEVFSHVYLYAVLPDGSRLPLDASHGDYPGWQVPSAHVSRRQVWDASGNPVADRGSRFDGLHNYGLRRGLGVDGDYGGEYTPDTVADPYLQPGGTSYDLGPGYFGSQAPQSSALTVPSQNSAAWAGFVNSLKGVLTLAQMYALKPGMQVLPNGTVMQQNPGYAIGTPTGALNLGSGISTTTILIAVVALGAVMMMSKGGR
jgi:hypothetical protein